MATKWGQPLNFCRVPEQRRLTVAIYVSNVMGSLYQIAGTYSQTLISFAALS